MKLNLSILFSILFLFSIKCFAQADGDYSISGVHSKYGAFNGHGWIRNGVVQRLVRYDDFRYQDKLVEEIWTGNLNDDLKFILRQSNLLTSFNDYSPSDESFKAPIEVLLTSEIFNNELFYKVTNEDVKEKWNYAGKFNKEALWTDLRYTSQALGKNQSFIKFISKLTYIDKAIENYRALPELDLYRERPEFKSATQYVIRDKTDADFYLQNPNVLRITNKTTNPLSLAEALMRRNAYGQTLAAKEKFLRFETLKYNFNKAGMLETGIIDKNGIQIGKQTEYDSALWSAMFGWSELLRFQVTKDPEAVTNFRKVLNAVLTLIEITHDPKEFARSLAISSTDENLGEGWMQGEGEFAHLKWRKGGNNDMVKGVFITLTLAHQVVKQDERELITRIKNVVAKLSALEAVDKRAFNEGIAQGLEALWNKDEKKVSKFYNKIFDLLHTVGKINDLGTGLYFGGISDWSGIHLNMVSSFSQLLLAKELQTVFTEGKASSKAIKIQKEAEEKLIGMFHIYKNVRRDFLPLMIWAFIPEFQKDPKNKEEVNEALWSLKEIPAPRSIGNAKADLSKHYDWSMSAWPRLPWKAIGGFRKFKDNFDFLNLRQGAYAYPYFEGVAWNSSYMWKNSPYEFKYESNAAVKTFSADYLLIYWASRASRLISAND